MSAVVLNSTLRTLRLINISEQLEKLEGEKLKTSYSIEKALEWLKAHDFDVPEKKQFKTGKVFEVIFSGKKIDVCHILNTDNSIFPVHRKEKKWIKCPELPKYSVNIEARKEKDLYGVISKNFLAAQVFTIEFEKNATKGELTPITLNHHEKMDQ